MAHVLLSHIEERATLKVFYDFFNIYQLPYFCAFPEISSLREIKSGEYLAQRRSQETEADVVGAFLAARSCYDVRFAPVTWAKKDLFVVQKNSSYYYTNIEKSTHPDMLNRLKTWN